jgi:hypothetical protein
VKSVMIVICHYYIIYYKRELVDNTWSNPPSLSKGCNQFSISAILEYIDIFVVTLLDASNQNVF